MAVGAWSVPAKPGQKRTIVLPNGQTVTATLCGDEHMHYWKTDEGATYVERKAGDFKAINVAEVTEKMQAQRMKTQARRQQRLMKAQRRIGDFGDYTGDKKGIIILAEFADSKFRDGHDQSLFNDIANEEGFTHSDGYIGSVHDYFYDQSRGLFNLTFDVVGPVQLADSVEYYGANDDAGNDVRDGVFAADVIHAAADLVDFSDYDWDGDGEVDQVFIIYAGLGEANGGSSITIWPHEWELSDSEYGDTIMLNGVTIDTYACGPELQPSGGWSSAGKLNGIGTICHEFSHCLGFPDFYDIDYSGGYGMSTWDLMCSGSHNNNGFCPPGYTSYERWMAGWDTPVELTNDTVVGSLPSLAESGQSFIIYNAGHKDEYYLLENRQKVGWDSSVAGEGLLIIHVDYDEGVWAENGPNDDPNHQRMIPICADNKTYRNNTGTDVYPYNSNDSLTNTSRPAATLYNANADESYYMNVAILNITQNDDGSVSFGFENRGNIDPSAGIVGIRFDEQAADEQKQAQEYFSLDGRKMSREEASRARIYIKGGKKIVR